MSEGAHIQRSAASDGSDVRYDAIVTHIERHLGPIAEVFREPAGTPDPVIDVCHVAPAVTRPVHTLVTSGMSAHAMKVPPGSDSPRYLELMVTLPQSWRLDATSMRQRQWAWPVTLLQQLAHTPASSDTWLGWGHAIPNGSPPQAFAPNTRLCSAIIVPSLLVPTEFYQLEIGLQRIAFFAVVPLYREELEFRNSAGMEALFGKLIDRNVKDLIDPRRRNAMKKILGLF